jgi:prepilin-type processing-associated H-X9-DG protein
MMRLHYGYNWKGTLPVLTPGAGFGLGGYPDEADVVRYRPRRESAVVAPSRMIAVGDGQASVHLALDGFHLPYEERLFVLFPHPLEVDTEDGEVQVLYPGVGHWHNGGANMLFCDGHVEFARQKRWTAATDDARRQWNYDNQPH